MNKKADITVVILVLGVLIVCALTLFSFMSFSFKIQKSLSQVSAVEELDAKISEYLFYKEHNIPNERFDDILGINGNYFVKSGDGISIVYPIPR
jgi:hypothetical protein